MNSIFAEDNITSSMVLLFGFDAADAAQLAQLLGPDAEVIVAAGEDDALQRLARAAPGTLLCLGSSLRAGDAAAFLRRASGARAVVLAAGSEAETFQHLVDADQIFFLSRRPPPLDEVAALLRGALRHDQRRREDNAAAGAPGAMLVARAISRVVDRIATETDLERISGLVGEAARGLTDAGEARFAVYDPLHETLWFRSLDARETVRNSAAAGLVSFVARTGEALAVDRAGDDPRYDADADNARRSPQERFLGVPMLAPGAAFADTLGVLVVTREPDREAFEETDRQHLENLAMQIAPIVRHRISEKQMEEAVAAADDPLATDGAPLYRREALHSYLRRGGEPGRVLELKPRRISRDRSRPARNWLGLRRPEQTIPFFQQTTQADCGAACMTMVLAAYGKHVPMREVREVMGVARDGADARQLLAGADWYGLRARAVRVTEPENLESLPSRSILHWQFHHFVVLERTTGEGAWIVDPAAGRRLVGWSELRTAFTG